MKKLFLIICLFVSSCATTEGYQRLLNETIGMTEDELIMKMGVPDKTHDTKTMRVLEYRYNSTDYIPNYQQQTTNYSNLYGRNIGSSSQWVDNGYYVNSSCTTTFYLKKGRVINYRFNGDACRA